jgi:hypothetical protein
MPYITENTTPIFADILIISGGSGSTAAIEGNLVNGLSYGSAGSSVLYTNVKLAARTSIAYSIGTGGASASKDFTPGTTSTAEFGGNTTITINGVTSDNPPTRANRPSTTTTSTAPYANTNLGDPPSLRWVNKPDPFSINDIVTYSPNEIVQTFASDANQRLPISKAGKVIVNYNGSDVNTRNYGKGGEVASATNFDMSVTPGTNGGIIIMYK